VINYHSNYHFNETQVMKKISLFLLIVLGAWTFQACDSSKKTDSAETAEEMNEENDAVKEDDSEFAVEAASGGLLEVELGRMAQEKGKSQGVKDFGAMMVKDHSKANDELKTLATSKNIVLPSTPSEEHQKHINDLAKLSGAEFDKEYIKMMTDDHEKDVKLFKEAADDAKDADIKAFAAKTLPTLEQHLSKIKAMKEAM
jgi:putative membrane protein